LLHNDELGKITKEQRAGEFTVWKTDLHNPDFSKYAEICGAKGIRVTRKEDLDAALKEARDYDGPALVEVMADAKLV
jgi:thiamine pyrophosphate-dependent acetolactate synthase large subunit-like protein